MGIGAYVLVLRLKSKQLFCILKVSILKKTRIFFSSAPAHILK